MAKHCDDYIDDPEQPEALRTFLHYARLPAVCKCAGVPRDQVRFDYIAPELHEFVWTQPEPILFADWQGRRVRVNVASRFGDVGITENLRASTGYTRRVMIEELSNFSATQH